MARTQVGIVGLLRADLDSVWALFTVRGLATLFYRVSARAGRTHPALGSIFKQFNHLLTGADIAWQAEIGPNLSIFHPTGVVIGKYVCIGSGAIVQGGVTIGGTGRSTSTEIESVVVGDDCSFGAGSTLVGPLTLGDRVSVGAGAVVTRSFPDGSTLVGIPARSRS
ncbi:serine O-acetyltransferase [Nocardioides bruguierae]|uniref:serine O-acetyltransferase n=1 Tax=Nocardioides bruguierae TaxID=2945102 RepID=UPI003556F67B